MAASAEVMRWVRALQDADHRPEGMSDEAADALVMRRERLIHALAMEPNRSPDDVAAKLAVLCRRLRLDAQPSASWRMANYLLAESARDGLLAETPLDLTYA